MLSAETIKRLDIIQAFSVKLNDPAFAQTDPLWKKHKNPKDICEVEHGKKYAYRKIGRTLGLQTIRYLSISKGFLFYFDQAISEDYLGYCNLQNVYLEWFRLKSHRYLLVISNGFDTSLFYFDSPTFWEEQKENLCQSVIQLNFYNEYYVLDELGEGSFSKVYHVKNKQSGHQYAAKMISKSDVQKSLNYKHVSDEKRILKLMKGSKYSYQFKQFYEQNQEFILLMDLVPGQDLGAILKSKQKFNNRQLKQLLINILKGLQECHSRSVIHRDVKPQNIIVNVEDNMSIKIIDFGLSTHYNKSAPLNHQKCGTIGYMAPQLFDSFSIINENCDIFSFGILAHLVLLGVNPLKGRSYNQTAINNQQCMLQLKENQITRQYGQLCLIFLKKMLQRSPINRFSAQQALENPYLRNSSDKQQWLIRCSIIQQQQTPILLQY